MAKGKDHDAVVVSSGNVFADLGLRAAYEKQTRVRLAVAVNQIIAARSLSQTKAARLLKYQSTEDFSIGELPPRRFLGGTVDTFS